MRYLAIAVLILVCVVLAAFQPAGPADRSPVWAAVAPLRAGVAVVDITPSPGGRMAGYFNERINTGVAGIG